MSRKPGESRVLSAPTAASPDRCCRAWPALLLTLLAGLGPGLLTAGCGGAMDYDGTIYEEWVAEGMFDDSISALLRQEGDRWFVVTYDIGATDVSYVGWPKAYGAPAALLGLSEEEVGDHGG